MYLRKSAMTIRRKPLNPLEGTDMTDEQFLAVAMDAVVTAVNLGTQDRKEKAVQTAEAMLAAWEVLNKGISSSSNPAE